MTTGVQWTEHSYSIAGLRMAVREAGSGTPVVVLHRDTGDPGPLAFHDLLAQRHSVYLPRHPGWDGTERPEWARSVRDLAAMYQWLIAELGLERPRLVGLGFGGYIAAEMAVQAPRDFAALALAGAMGVKPPAGEIADQALLSHLAYVHAGFADPEKFVEVYGAEPPAEQLEAWEMNREMVFRVAWRPYMYDPALPHLLGGVRAPALIAWGREDRIVPISAGEAYAGALSRARLELIDNSGHCVELERPDALARLVLDVFASA